MLVVDDEPTIAEVVARYLERAGYRTRVAADGARGDRRGGQPAARPGRARPDAPGLDGLEVMRRLREADRDRIAVILLTAKGEESDRVIGLRLGADDYVVKPFSPAELVARVDAVLRRFDTSPAHESSLIDRRDRDRPGGAPGVRGGEEVQLTQREFDVLLFLARHPGQVFSRNQLMDAIWQYSFYTDTSTVTVHIRRLRSKIEADPSQSAPHPDGVGSRLPVPADEPEAERCGRPSDLGAIAAAAWAGSLSRQFAMVVAIVIAPVLLGLVVVGLLMVISGHDVTLLAAIVVGAGAFAVVAAKVLAGGILRDVETIRDGLEAVGARRARRPDRDLGTATSCPSSRPRPTR